MYNIYMHDADETNPIDETNPQQFEDTPQPSRTYHSLIVVGVILGVLVLIGTVVLIGNYFYSIKKEVLVTEPVIEKVEQPAGLGAGLFEDVDNPIEDKIPTVQTTVNPIKEIYKNPFE